MGTLVFAPEMLPVLFLKRDNLWEFIRFELLIFGRVDIIESPLFQRDVSADKTDKPAILAIEIIDY